MVPLPPHFGMYGGQAHGPQTGPLRYSTGWFGIDASEGGHPAPLGRYNASRQPATRHHKAAYRSIPLLGSRLMETRDAVKLSPQPVPNLPPCMDTPMATPAAHRTVEPPAAAQQSRARNVFFPRSRSTDLEKSNQALKNATAPRNEVVFPCMTHSMTHLSMSHAIRTGYGVLASAWTVSVPTQLRVAGEVRFVRHQPDQRFLPHQPTSSTR